MSVGPERRGWTRERSYRSTRAQHKRKGWSGEGKVRGVAALAKGTVASTGGCRVTVDSTRDGRVEAANGAPTGAER